MMTLLIQPEKVPSAFAVEEAAVTRRGGDMISPAPRPSWTRRLAAYGRQALETHRQVQNSRGAAAW